MDRSASEASPSTPPARRSRRGAYAKSAEVRRAILSAAEEVFAEQGFRSGSIRAIADRVGMSETGLMHHAGSKAKLMLDVLALRDQWQAARFGALSTPAEHLGELLRVAATNMLEPGVTAMYCVLSAEATSPDHPAHSYFRQRNHHNRLALEAAFTELAESGDLASGAVPAVCARNTLALLDGLQLQWLLDPTAIDIAGDLHAYLVTIVSADTLAQAQPSAIAPRTGPHRNPT